MRIKNSKKAISPLVATVILIGVAIVLFGIIFFWISNMISDQTMKFEVRIETQCDNVAFSATVDGDEITVSNQGNLPIVGMTIQITSNGKTITKGLATTVSGVIEPMQTDVIIVDEKEFPFASASKRVIMPMLQGKLAKSGKMNRYTCQNKAMTV